jgi:hypothetical protein
MSNRSNYGSKGGGSMESVPYQGEDEDEVWCSQIVKNWYIAKDRYNDWCLFGTNFESSEIAWPRIRGKDHANSARGWGSRGIYFTTVNGSTYCVSGPRKQHKSKKRNRRSQAPSENKKMSSSSKTKYSPKSYMKKPIKDNSPKKSSKYRRLREQEKEKEKRKQMDKKIYGRSRYKK